jgi:hypothetical protein
MKNIIAIAALGLVVTACDPFNSEAGGTPAINEVVVTGRNYGPVDAVEAGGTWTATGVTPAVVGSSGRMVLVTANQLLDGASIESTPGSCLQASGWLAIGGTGAAALATAFPTGVWYTCYYPSSATAADGGSVFIYFSVTPPGLTTAAQPIRAGNMVSGTYTFTGTVKSKSGDDLAISVAVTVT